MKFLNYPRQTPLSQLPILSQPWGNLVVDAIAGVVKFRTREDGIVELDLERGARKRLTNVVTEKVGRNLYYGIDVTIHWWEWENEPIWYLLPFARTSLSGGGTRDLRVGDSALRIGKGHVRNLHIYHSAAGVKTLIADSGQGKDKYFLGIRGFNEEVFEKLQARISRIEESKE